MEKNLPESVKNFLEKRQLKSVKDFYDTPGWRQILDDKETIEEQFARHYRHCGDHSNIPACCVEFYVKQWRGKEMCESFIGRIYRFLKVVWYPSDRMPAYVPCPKCLIKRYAQRLNECDWKSESVGLGECKPTGRVIGFDHEDIMSREISRR